MHEEGKKRQGLRENFINIYYLTKGTSTTVRGSEHARSAAYEMRP